MEPQLRTRASKLDDGRLPGRYSRNPCNAVPVEPRFGRELRRGELVDSMFTMRATMKQPFNLR